MSKGEVKYRDSKNAIIYTRVSDQNQVDKGHSLREQEPMLREFSKKEGYIVKEVFTDAGKTATSTVGRDGLYDALQYIVDDPSIGALIVQDTDRIARDEIDHFGIRFHLKKYGVQLIAKNQPHLNDSPEGKLLDAVLAAVNAFQSRITGRKVSNLIDVMARKGKTMHQAPLGYINTNLGTEERPNRVVKVHPENGKLIKEAFTLYASGNYSLTDLSQIMNEKGLKTLKGNLLRRSSTAEMIKNAYYIGKLKHKGVLYDGKHEPLINDDVFRRCQEILAEHNQYAIRKRKPENHEKFYLRGFLRCGICNHAVAGSTVKKKKHDYYYCSVKSFEKGHHSNKGQTTSVQELETQIFDFFSLLDLSPQVMESVLKRAEELLNQTHNDTDEEIKKLERQNIVLKKQRENLEVKLLEGVITNEVYTRQHNRIETEIDCNNSTIIKLSKDRKGNIKLFESLVKLARNLPKAYKEASPRVKMMYLQIFWDKFEMKDTKIQRAIPSKAVSAMINDNLISLKANNAEKKVLIKNVWLPRLDSNQ